MTVEKSLPLTPGVAVPACLDGRRACPPEDCGGPWGYKELLEILADPSHEEHAERVEWVGEWGGGRLDPKPSTSPSSPSTSTPSASRPSTTEPRMRKPAGRSDW